MKKKISLLLGMVLMFFCVAQAQIENPIKWKVDFNTTSDTEAEIVFSATVEKGWHLYSTNIPDGGPVPTTINFDEKTGIELVGALTPVGKTVTLFEDAFGLDVTYFENEGKGAGGTYKGAGQGQGGSDRDDIRTDKALR